MALDLAVARPAPLTPQARGACRVGAAAVDITPHPGIAMAGYSTDGHRARAVGERLYARALAFEDAAGERAALCVVDLMSASRYLLERTAALAAVACGISVDRLVLCGTHTHTAPGHFYGDGLYDRFAACDAGFDAGLADWLASRAAHAVTVAFAGAREATVGIGTTEVWGVGRNASLVAFGRNPEAARWNEAQMPGHGARAEPADPGTVVDAAQPAVGAMSQTSAVDPRLTTLAAFDAAGAVIGAVGIFACHNTALGGGHTEYHPDWMGLAVRAASHALGGEAVMAMAPGPGGDVNTLGMGMPQGVELAVAVGERLGTALVEGVEVARSRARAFDIEMRWSEIDPTERCVDDRPDTELADHWYFGMPTLCGGDEARTWLYRRNLVRPGWTSPHFPPAHPQHPKARAFGPLHDPVRRALSLEPPLRWPLHTLRLGDHLIATVPGEPTVTAGHRIEQALGAAAGVRGVSILGYAGAYVGYVTTAEEYDAQHYEGASCLFGRNTASHLQAHLLNMVRGPAATPPLGPVAFRTCRAIARFAQGEAAGSGHGS
jgi:neutral ceramidase